VIISLVLFAVCVVVWITAASFDNFYHKWISRPNFVYNYIGGVLAVCSITDYKKTIPNKDSGEGYFFRRVRDTLAFSNDENKHFAGKVEWLGKTAYPAECELYRYWQKASDLFVPFTSEKFFSIADQENFFVQSVNVQEFEKKKREENNRDDFRIRFIEWWPKCNLHKLYGWSIAGTIIMFFILGFTSLAHIDHANNERKIVVYTTQEDGSVQTIETTGENVRRLLMYHIDNDSFTIVRGKVSAIQILGGGSTRTCLRRENGDRICGFASSDFKIGDEAFARRGCMMAWEQGKTLGGNTYDDWLITKKEAEALFATGKFRIVD